MDAAGGPHNRGGGSTGSKCEGSHLEWKKGLKLAPFFVDFNSDRDSARPGLTTLPPRMDDYCFRFDSFDRVILIQQEHPTQKSSHNGKRSKKL